MVLIQTTAAIAATAFANVVRAKDPEEGLPCVPMGELYPTGEELCERMWDDAFEVVDDDVGYTMYHYSDVNPNDRISNNLGLAGADKQCYLDDWFHKKVPGPENLDFECGAFRGNACCKNSTVTSAEVLRDNYGAGYRWDRCGKLSPQCERFFVQEACFYECDPNNGYWRKFVDLASAAKMPDSDKDRLVYNPKCNPRDENEWDDFGEDGKSKKGKEWYANNKALCGNTTHNRWQLYKTPIKRSYCNAWHDACRRDLFCGVKDGSFLKCAREVPVPEAEVVEVLSDGALAGIIIAVLLVGIAVAVIAVMVTKERRGNPIFQKLVDEDDEKNGAEENSRMESPPSDISRVDGQHIML